MATQIKIRRGLASEWTSSNPVLSSGEMGIETDTRKFKFGDGLSTWSSLSYSVDKSQIGLSEVSNTSDENKPLSIATQSALDLKANASNVTSSLALKANESDLISGLALKANASEVSSSLALKANVSDVYAKSQTDSIASNTLSSANSYADIKVAGIVNSAPTTLDTLNELASALGNDPNFATTTATLIGEKANSSDVTASLALKVDKITGKGLSAEDFTTSEKSKLAGISSGATANQTDYFLLSRANHTGSQLASTISDFTSAVQLVNIDASKIDGGAVSNAEFATLDGINTGLSIQSQIDLKVDKIAGKGLSTEDYSTAEKAKLAGIATGATANSTDAQLRDRSTHTGNESTLTFSEGSAPSAPASGLTIFAEANGKQMLGQVPKVGRPYPFQPHLGQTNAMIWLPNANVTTSTVLGQVAPTANGTATLRTVALTSSFASQRKIGYISAATANQSSGLRSAVLQVGLSSIAGTGGFFYQTRFGISDAVLVANARTFVGLVAQTTALGNIDPSTVLNTIGMGHDSADANFSIMSNNGAGTATKIDLGTGFTRSPTVSSDMYDLILYAAPNSVTVFYQVMNMRTGATASGSVTNKLPVTNTLLTWQHWRQNGGTAAAVGIDIASVYLETEY